MMKPSRFAALRTISGEGISMHKKIVASLIGVATTGLVSLAFMTPAVAATNPPTKDDRVVTAAVTPQDSCDYRVVINGNGVRIRTAPSTSATVVGLGYDGDTYEYLGQVPGWYEIYGGHWVSMQYSYNYAWCI